MSAPGLQPSRLQALQAFLEQDADNPALLEEAADAALGEGRLTLAHDLIARAEQLGAPSPQLTNLSGLLALRERRYDDAADKFEAAFAAIPDAPAVRFNLAWARMMTRDYEGANAVLDEATAIAIPAAAKIKIQALHHLGMLEDALALGERLVERLPEDVDLRAALADVAVDAEDAVLARRYAASATTVPQSLATLGMLELGDERAEAANELFDQALQRIPENPRALLGKGLVLLTSGEPAAASPYLEKGAAGFGSHLGSWIAAGWARFAAGDHAGARANFEQALALDDTFAETHGALAVVDLAEGKIDSARKRVETTGRLDRESLGGALAASMLLTNDGDPERARRVMDIALNQPVGPGGRTILQSIVGLTAPRRDA